MKTARIAAHMNCTPFTAAVTLAVIRGELDPLKYPRRFPATDKWVRSCYNKPRKSEVKLHALNELHECSGVEGVQIEGAWVDSYHRDYCASYLNTGDTYSATILLDHIAGKWRLTTWGDWYEQNEQAAVEV